MKHGLRFAIGLGLLTALVLALPASALAVPRATPVAGGTLVVGFSADPNGIQPGTIMAVEDGLVCHALYDSLTSWDPLTSAVRPAVAKSWSVNAKATVWTFHLRHGVRFSNGKKVQARDFKYAWEALCREGAPMAYLLGDVKGFAAMQAGHAAHLSGVSAPSKYTLIVTLAHADADFATEVGQPGLAPVPYGALDTKAQRKTFANKPIGDGPFKMAKAWVHGKGIEMVANANYYGTKPHVAGISFRVESSASAAYAAFVAGKVDYSEVPHDQLSAAIASYGQSTDGYTAEPGHQVLTGPEQNVYALVMNTKKGPLAKPDVRRAISLAIDRASFCASLSRAALPADDYVPATMPGYKAGSWPYATYDAALAATKLAAAGYPGGAGLPTLTLLYLSNSEVQAEEATAVQASLATIGVQTQLREKDSDAAITLLMQGKFDLSVAFGGWWADYPTMNDFLTPCFGPANNSLSFYSDPAVSAKLNQARRTLKLATRLQLLQQADAAIGKAAPVAPLYWGAHCSVAASRIHDAVLSPTGLFDFQHVWIH
jgi:ABC-type transport system substrate-binding protein